MNFYPIYRNKKLLPWIKWWLIKGNKIAPKHLSEWINSASAITITGVYKGSPLLFLNLNGNTSQTGTPTPEAPVPVNVVKGNNTIKINDTDYQVNLKGKNLFNVATITLSKYVDGSTGNLMNSTSSNASDFIEIISNTTYKFSFDYESLASTGSRAIVFYNSNKAVVGTYITYNPTDKLRTFTTPNDSKYIRITLDKNAINIQVEQGSEVTPYEPYYDYELCKIGDYQDVIYKESNKWYIDKYINKFVINGTETTNPSLNTSATNTVRIYYNYDLIPSGVHADEICNRLQTKNVWGNDEEGIYISASTKVIMRINKTTCGTSLSEVNSWLQSNNVILYYRLTTSTTTEITGTTLLSQLEAIYNAKLQSGTNTITQTPSDLPFYLNFQYYEKG